MLCCSWKANWPMCAACGEEAAVPEARGAAGAQQKVLGRREIAYDDFRCRKFAEVAAGEEKKRCVRLDVSKTIR